MSLDLKYRPKTFDDIIGEKNKKEVEKFQRLLEKDGGPQSFILSGPSGCGKTTLARIAQEFIGASILSASELNTGNNRGIDTIREIIDQTRYVSIDDSRVFIIDEAHGLTPDAKRALLKPTEEPGDGVYFFLLTTDPSKLFKGDEGKALKTRLTSIKVFSAETREIYKHLRRIGKAEDLEISTEVYTYISENCEGSPRKALNMLGSIQGLDDEEEIFEVLENISFERDPEVFEFCQELMKSKPSWKILANMLLSFKEKKTPEEVRQIVLGYFQSVLLKNGKSKAAHVLDCFCAWEYKDHFPGITLATWESIHTDED
jgi:DNA polymerase III gamma/tau subunit